MHDLSDDPKFRLLATTWVTTSLLLLKAMLGRKVYKRKLIDCLDTLSIFNILVFSLISFYTIGNQSSQQLAAMFSIGSAIIMFLFIICYHTKLSLLEISLFKRKMDLIKRKVLGNRRNHDFIEMNANTESVVMVTSSEVSVSPAHNGTENNIIVGETDADLASVQDNNSKMINLREHAEDLLREPLLL